MFIPMGINYDRVFEDRSLLRYAKNLAHKNFGYILGKTLTFAGKNFWQALLGERYRYGYACVNYGEPVSLKKWIAERYDNRDELPFIQDVFKPAAHAPSLDYS